MIFQCYHQIRHTQILSFRAAIFPFQGHLRFDVPGTLSNTLISNVNLEFRISQKGAWLVTVEMLASN
ncbi:MAG: hypothetical protein U5K79_04205 [Cyclobacteriaceae bacterium]|nr:hypothetical protein [Cyclobacteriaceae bacterium]